MANPNLTVTAVLDELAELVPAKVRTVLYAAALVVALLALAAQWAVGIWWPELDGRVDQTTAGVLAAALLVVGALGTAYRPTRGALPDVYPAARFDVGDQVITAGGLAGVVTIVNADYPGEPYYAVRLDGDTTGFPMAIYDSELRPAPAAG